MFNFNLYISVVVFLETLSFYKMIAHFRKSYNRFINCFTYTFAFCKVCFEFSKVIDHFIK